ncbi:MAG TPA: hypothetical protein VG246_01350 [Acidimicrobiales bacterium]|jgi:hypothetical protein|nr:hypothetical protein [Acidimicrobiales bacterium]
MNAVLTSLVLGAQVTNVHRGAVLPEGRIVVILVPLAALAFYVLVVRRNRDR